jgi:regulator of sirC expression with transglutaminase-like and TPR domain
MEAVTFAQVIGQRPVDISYASLLFAREIAYPGLDVTHYMYRLEELARWAEREVPLSGRLADKVEALSHFLFAENQFQGNVTDYGDPRNSFLNEVLERRLGIPISLSVLYVAVARELGLDAYGVGLPGHFIVGVQDGVETLLLDPFHGGERVGLGDCERLVAETVGYEGPLESEWLEPVGPRATLTRMLNNLRISYIQRREWPQTVAVLRHLRQVQPDAPEHLRDLGLVYYQQGELYPAAVYLEEYLEQAPETPEAQAIQQNLRNDFARWARLN